MKIQFETLFKPNRIHLVSETVRPLSRLRPLLSTLSSSPIRSYSKAKHLGPRNARIRLAVLPKIQVARKTPRPAQIVLPRDPTGLVTSDSPAGKLLANPALILIRELEMLAIFTGFAPGNRYAINDENGNGLGYVVEETTSTSFFSRALLKNHRPFQCTILDPSGQVLLRVQRPLQIINSSATISLGSDPHNIIGECRQEWHPFRRRYNLFKKSDDDFQQIATIDAPTLSWTFLPTDANGKVIASIDRNWLGVGQELFTNRGQYVVRFDAAADEQVPVQTQRDGKDVRTRALKELVPIREGVTLDERAILLATAMSLDVDYFSRTGHGPSMMPLMFPFPLPMPGGEQTGPVDTQDTIDERDHLPSSDDYAELPRSDSADEAAQQYGWDEEPMHDPFATDQGLDEGGFDGFDDFGER